MDGLIPMVYRSLKKYNTRRRYEYLSSRANFYVKDDLHLLDRDYIAREHYFSAPGTEGGGGGGGGSHHPRYNSVGVDFYSGGRGGDEVAFKYKPQKQLVKLRSHKIFSCITGGA